METWEKLRVARHSGVAAKQGEVSSLGEAARWAVR